MNSTQHKLRRMYMHIKRRYATTENLVVLVAVVIAASWAWGSVSMMQRNFGLQKDVDAKRREAQLTELEVQSLEYQQNYYKSDEYRELVARERLGLALPGEKVLMLPPNSDKAKQEETTASSTTVALAPQSSNVDQWMNFLTGKAAERLQE